MAIDINNLPPSSTHVAEMGTQPRPSTTPSPTEKTAEQNSALARAADQVSLTPTAQQLRQLEQTVAAQPVVDTQKVNAVKEALANGSFEINPDRIAGKMMSMERAIGDMA